MTTYSSIPAYVLGSACVARGFMAVFSPRAEYAHVGLPLELRGSTNTASGKRSDADGAVSPLMYFKAIREVTFGLTMVALQIQGHQAALTTFCAIVSLARFGDGLVVWVYGGSERYRAWGHWITGAGFVGWVLWRWSH